jgi:hypothetical protein
VKRLSKLESKIITCNNPGWRTKDKIVRSRSKIKTLSRSLKSIDISCIDLHQNWRIDFFANKNSFKRLKNTDKKEV